MGRDKPAEIFHWRDSKGVFHTPQSMATRHLFCTLRMIWNHRMPEEAKTHNYIKYKFGAFYTRRYMLQAVEELAFELKKRTDLTEDNLTTFARMIAWLKANGTETKELCHGTKS